MENSILIVDDDPGVIAAIRRSLLEEPYVVYTANNGMDGVDLLKMHKIKLVISDEKMPGMSGTEFLSTVKNMFPGTVRIMLTGYAVTIQLCGVAATFRLRYSQAKACAYHFSPP